MPMPKPLTIPFARDALSQFINEIPDTPQAGADPQLASWSEGFGPITMQPLHSGGKPPEGPDFNGILSALSKHIVYQNGGGMYKFSQEYVDKTGGYDKGSVLIGGDGSALWVSLSDNNTENFNTATPPTEWIKISSAGVEQQIQDILTMIGTKADKTTQVIAGTGLSGGGNLQANRTLSVNYGTTAGTAAQGNDSRITGAAQKSANLSDLSSATAARQNLGLGTAATRDVGESSGNVMEVGAFGIGTIDRIDYPAASLDTVVGSGLYFAPASKGFPFTPDGHVLVASYSSEFAVQIAYDYRSAKTMRRSLNYGAWTEWMDYVVSSNLLTTTGQSALYPMTQKAVTDALSTKVGLSGNQTISGLKTFSQFPVTPSAAPTANYQAANKKYVDDKSNLHPSMAGSITLNGTTDNTVVMTDIVTELDLEIGDVIRIDTGAYNKLHTVESITNNSSIIVNYEHAGNRGDGSLKLPDFTGQATVTRIAKWFNAPIGLGQAWIDLTAQRAIGTSYTNSTARLIPVSIGVGNSSSEYSYVLDGVSTPTQGQSSNVQWANRQEAYAESVRLSAGQIIFWLELR